MLDEVTVVHVDSCPAGVIVGADIAQQIRALELAAFGASEPDTGEPWVCSLSNGHASAHITHVLDSVTSDYLEWWLRWETNDCTLFQALPCEANGPVHDVESGDRTFCLLYDEHDGEHAGGGAVFWTGSAACDE